MKLTSKLINLVFLITISFVFLTVSATEVVTIKDLQNNIKILEEKQGEISKKISSDLGDIGDIKTFLKEALSEKEIHEIKLIITNYNNLKSEINLNNNGKEELKKLLLELKRETYKKLIPYIEHSKLEEYLQYIRKNVDILKQGKEINEEIHKNRELLEQKVIILKEKIKTNEDKLKNEIDELINKKIDEKINIIKNNEKFKLLDLEKRKELINKTITKIKNILSKMEIKDENKKKIAIYNTVIEKLENVLSELK